MLALSSSALSFAPQMAPRTSALSRSGLVMQTKEELATALNPAIGYWDPLGLGTADFWSVGNEATLGFLRQAEIKHGRVSMAAFVGFIVQSNGIHWPAGFTPTWTYDASLSPPEQWDALPFEGKCQIIAFVGFLEWWSEFGGTHYMKGGKPGAFPEFKDIPLHKIPSLWDPAGFTKKMTPERKEKALLAEINNGRLAMFGIMGFLSAEKVAGSVPLLTFLKPYAGEVMQPF
tara:strand:- start:435 stop:1127 length:693 start_codon:yes stop_codon:yes gene_type:complete